MADIQATEDLTGQDEFMSSFAEKLTTLALEKRSSWKLETQSTLEDDLPELQSTNGHESMSEMSLDSSTISLDKEPINEFLLQAEPDMVDSSELSLKVNDSEDKKICKRCSTIPAIPENGEVQGNGSDTDALLKKYAYGDDKKVNEGPVLKPRVSKVMLKCKCHATPSIRKRLRDSVLCPTLVMHNYTKKVPESSLLRRKHAPNTQSVPGGIMLNDTDRRNATQEVIDQHQRTMELYITTPDESLPPEQRRVYLGAIVTTLEDEQGYLRHFVETVKPSTPASAVELKPEDELLLLNNQSLVGKDADQLKEMFATVLVDQPLTVMTRRMIKPENEGLSLESVQYEYWQISTTIRIEITEGKIIPEAANVSRSYIRNGDIIVGNKVDVQTRYIKTNQGYLKNRDGQINISRQLQYNNPDFKFCLITYDGILMNNGDPQAKRIRMLRNTSGSDHYFLYMSRKSGNIKLMIAPSAIGAVPSRNTINKRRTVGQFESRNALFMSYPAGGRDVFYLEPPNKLGFYLKTMPTVPYVTIFRPSTPPLPYIDGVRFELVPA